MRPTCAFMCALPGETIQVSDDAAVNSTRDARLFANEPVVGEQVFDAMIRVIDAKDPSWRT